MSYKSPEQRGEQEVLSEEALEGLGGQRGPCDRVGDGGEDPVQLTARSLALGVFPG